MITVDGRGEAMLGIHAHHLAKLRSSGLSNETIAANGLRSVDDHRVIADMLNRDSWSRRNGSVLAIPYFGESGEIVMHRVRPDNPPRRGSGKPQKYLQPSGTPTRPYFPKGVREAIANRDQPIIITEGEFKALCATQYGFPAISIPGVDCWHAKKSLRLVAELERIEWRRRKVYIAFDSDAADNPRVRDNEILLADALMKMGALYRRVTHEGSDGK